MPARFRFLKDLKRSENAQGCTSVRQVRKACTIWSGKLSTTASMKFWFATKSTWPLKKTTALPFRTTAAEFGRHSEKDWTSGAWNRLYGAPCRWQVRRWRIQGFRWPSRRWCLRCQRPFDRTWRSSQTRRWYERLRNRLWTRQSQKSDESHRTMPGAWTRHESSLLPWPGHL